MVRSAISKAIEAKYPRDRLDDEPMPRLKRKGPIRKIHRASGVVDIYDERDDGDEGDQAAPPIERSSSLVGYESVGSPINEDDVEADRWWTEPRPGSSYYSHFRLGRSFTSRCSATGTGEMSPVAPGASASFSPFSRATASAAMAMPSFRPNAMPSATAIAMFSWIIPIRSMNRTRFLMISLALSRSVSMELSMPATPDESNHLISLLDVQTDAPL